MRQLVWTKTFVRAYKRNIQRHPSLVTDIEEALTLLVQDPFNPKLRSHKLKGKTIGSVGVQRWI